MKLNVAVFALAAFAAAGAASAQSERRGGPADASARVPAFRYESAFAGYRASPEEKAVPWREANEEVRRPGGHVGHVPGLLPPGQAAPPAATAPAASPRSGHATHGARK